jgi:hypothetical protein
MTDDRDFVEIPMRGTTRELAEIQGEDLSPSLWDNCFGTLGLI